MEKALQKMMKGFPLFIAMGVMIVVLAVIIGAVNSANANAYVQTVVGDQVDIANVGSGSTLTGHSTASITAAPVGNGNGPAQVRIVGFVNGEIYNATTNPFPEVFVEIVQHQFNSGAGQAAV